MGEFISLVNTWLTEKRKEQAIKRIIEENEARRNITKYGASDIEAFIQRDPYVGSYIISGGSALNSAKAASSAAACSLAQGIPVVVLHEGNQLFENVIVQATSFTGNKIIITSNTAVYDPFYNRTNNEICNLILDSCNQALRINATGQQYIVGVADFIKSKNIPPYFEMFVSCPHDVLFDKLDEAEQNGYLSSNDAQKIRNELMQGQSERSNIQSFFSQLSYQGRGILSTKGNRNAAVNIKTAVDHNGLLMIDIGSSTNELLLNVIVSEIKEVLATGKRMMLILDDISINSNESLNRLIKSLSARCLTTLLSPDVYSMLGGDDNLFHTFSGNASKCIVFSHTSGTTCEKWSEIFGYYEKDKITENIAATQDFNPWGYGSANSKSYTISRERELRVKPEEISSLTPNEVYIIDRNANELVYSLIN